MQELLPARRLCSNVTGIRSKRIMHTAASLHGDCVRPRPESLCYNVVAPNAEITVFPWKDPPKARTINRARTFLKRHLPA
jgi:hypothetical protein